jgi:hypothetical protein
VVVFFVIEKSWSAVFPNDANNFRREFHVTEMEKKEKGFNFAFGKLMRDSPVKRGYKNSDSFLEIPTHFLVLEKSVRVKENHV